MKSYKPIKEHRLTFPSDILNDKRLSPTDRLLIALIIAYDKPVKGCFASNKTLANFANCSVGTVSRSINKMFLIGYIISNEESEEYGGRGYVRRVAEYLKAHKDDAKKHEEDKDF